MIILLARGTRHTGTEPIFMHRCLPLGDWIGKDSQNRSRARAYTYRCKTRNQVRPPGAAGRTLFMSKPNRRTVLQLSVAPFVGVPRARSRKRRADGFFGLHFDLHPDPDDKALGRDLSDAHAGALLDAVQPDFVQYDCKGHAGWLGYRSKVSDSPAGIVNDSLAIWRRATDARGIALVIHFSGVWDALAIKQHPEWGRVDEKGVVDPRGRASLFGDYLAKRMIPQLKEAIGKYDLDGVWLDGECWAVHPDYGAAIVAEWKKRTGEDAPRSEHEPGWQEWLAFHRKKFFSYVKTYVDAIRAAHPPVQIASNWLYSTCVPEKPAVPVDFLSGDYMGNAPVSKARLEARYLAQTGRPWDLMAWGFQQSSNSAAGPVFKPAVQVQQEASIVLAQGGGFQLYYQPTRAGRIEPHLIKVMAEVGRFCRARQAVSHRTLPVAEVGVLFSGRSLYRTTNMLFGNWGALSNPASGWIDLLLACHHSVDVIPDWRLDLLQSTPLVVVPEWTDLGPEVMAALRARTQLTIIGGAANARSLAREMGLVLTGEPSTQTAWLPSPEVPANARGLWQDIAPGKAQVLSLRHPNPDLSREGVPSVVRIGNFIFVPGPIGSAFATTHAPALREWLRGWLGPVFPARVQTNAPSTVELALRRAPGKSGGLLLHLINTTAMQVADDYAAVDFIPPLQPFTVSCAFPQAPRRAVWHPGGGELAVSWANGRAEVTIPRLDIHGVIEFPT